MKKGLLIQGPINSPGYGPYGFGVDGKFEKHWIDYDSRENILKLVERAASLFDHIVISTWDNKENRDFLDSHFKDTEIVYILVDEDERLRDLHQNGNHKYHQIKTMHEGAIQLHKLGCDLMAKIRTDQSLDLCELSKLCFRHSLRNMKSIGVPYVNLFELDRLTDFYFIGRSEVVAETCKWYLETDEIFADTHRDYFKKFAMHLGTKVHGTHFDEFSAWTSDFYPLTPKLHKDFYWRGLKVDNSLNSWLRWYFVFHAKTSSGFRLKLILNRLLLSSLRILIYPTIKPISFLKFRYFRYVSLKQRNLIGNK